MKSLSFFEVVVVSAISLGMICPAVSVIHSFDGDGNPILESKPQTYSRKYFDPVLRRVARETGIKAALLAAIIEHESRWDPLAVSSQGALGLMQLMPSTAKQFGVKNPFSPEDNVRGGARYLRFLLNMFKEDLSLALAAYHQGHSRIRKIQMVPERGGTKEYVSQVIKTYYRYFDDQKITAAF